MPFAHNANARPNGNANVRRVCRNPKCRGVVHITYGADASRRPHWDFRQGR